MQFYGALTSKSRMAPEFLIIGVQRGGTTSLYNYLIRHPLILPALVKEVHYFDLSFHKGINWYLGNFPRRAQRQGNQRAITGEASPYYIFHPHVPKRVFETFPSMKFILLLRNPIDRAYSHYQNEVRLGYEHLSFEDAIDQEVSRVDSETPKLLQDEGYQSINHRHFTYLSRGIYIDQLNNWLNVIPREQILIVKSEDFFESPQTILGKVLSWLDLPGWNFPGFRIHNRLEYQKMNPLTRDRLQTYYEPHNQALNDLVGMDFGWNVPYPQKHRSEANPLG